MVILPEARYGEFTRVVTHPPDFGVTDQLSEFLEEESSSSSCSSSSFSESSSSSTSSSSSEPCDCCNLEPVVLTVSGFPGPADLPLDPFFGTPTQCSCMEVYNGTYILPFDAVNAITFTKECVPTFQPACVWETDSLDGSCELNVPWGAVYRWLFASQQQPDGGIYINVQLYVQTPNSLGLTSVARWERVVDECDVIDVTLTEEDRCDCQLRIGADPLGMVGCFCDPVFPNNRTAPDTMQDVVIRVTCQEGEEGESSSSCTSSSSSVSELSASSASSTSTSSQSSSSSCSESSTSLSSRSSTSSSSSSSSTSSSSSMPDCLCCDPESPLSGTVFLKFNNILNDIGNPECFDQCDDINGICFALNRVEQCRWEGQVDTDATCYPVSNVVLTLSCNGSQVVMRLEWTTTASGTVVFEKTISGQYVDCDECFIHQLFHQESVNSPCDGEFGSALVNFRPYSNCCHLCPDQYEVVISGLFQGDGDGRCDEGECDQINGTYLLNFDSDNAFPVAGCSEFPGGPWCLYKSFPLNLSCNDANYGWCFVHLFVRVRDNCQTEIQLEIEADTTELFQCNGIIDHVVGAWYKVSDDDCRTLDETMTEQCGLQNWNCSTEDGTIRVRIPGTDDQIAFTKLTVGGYPGRRYGV